ncbi:MAG: antitoxin [Pseudomonadota bacterium]
MQHHEIGVSIAYIEKRCRQSEHKARPQRRAWRWCPLTLEKELIMRAVLIGLAIVVVVGAVAFVAFDTSEVSEGPAEEAGAAIDNAVEGAQEAIEDAGEAAGEVLEGAGDAVDEATGGEQN